MRALHGERVDGLEGQRGGGTDEQKQHGERSDGHGGSPYEVDVVAVNGDVAPACPECYRVG